MSYAKGSLVVTNGTGAVTALENIISGKIPVSDTNESIGIKWEDIDNITEKIKSVTLTDNYSTGSESYITIAYTSLPSTASSITKITALSYMANNPNNYSIRIYDDTNSGTIGESTFTNSSISLNTITITNGTVTNAPIIINIQLKIDDPVLNNGLGHIREINIHYI